MSQATLIDALLEPKKFMDMGNTSHCISGSIGHRIPTYPLKCLYLSTLLIQTIIRQIIIQIRWAKVKRSRKLGTGENLISWSIE